MTVADQVLQSFLQHPQTWLSGSELAAESQVSRTAVWKTIQNLTAAGYTIESRHGAGYRLLPNNQLSQAAIQAELPVDFPLQIQVHDQVTSTNSLAKQLATKRPIKPTAIVANSQTNGYGRYGRDFYSPSQSGLYLSLLLPVTGEPVDPGLLTTGTAVVVASSLMDLFKVPVSLKWVNDVLVNDHKAVGILTEAVADLETNQISAVIIGIGINLTTEKQQFPTAIQYKAGAVTDQLGQVTRNQVVTTILKRFMAMYPTYRQASFMPQYRKLSAALGKRVVIQQGPNQLEGQVQAIDDHGALVLKTVQGDTVTVTAGEITKLNLKDGNYHG